MNSIIAAAESDKIDKIGCSRVHHGPQSQRAFLLQYDQRDHDRLGDQLLELAETEGYSKIVLKLPGSACNDFLDAGFQHEARILNYFSDGEACYFLSRFLSPQRGIDQQDAKHKEIIQTAAARPARPLRPLTSDYRLARMAVNDCAEMAALFRKVFETYPFPIFDEKYLLETMRSHVVYFGVWYQGQLAALSSAETNRQQQNAEMTDFAILPHHRGRQLARHLLFRMEQEMQNEQIRTLYTIARSGSLPMNCTFSSCGYSYGGTLVNNTQISGQIESMNIWSKRI